MRPSRVLPRPGGRALVVAEPHHVGARILAVAGVSVEVETEDGRTLWFELHPNTGHFVLRGDPYWGTRLRLLA